MSLIKDYLHHKSNMERLEVLIAREQLMEDIDCIVSSQYGQGNEELADEMIKLLCDAVCRNFPTN